jgi:hypothetical protein
MTAQDTKDQSDTPITDAAEAFRENGGDVTDIFKAMRQLERDLAAMTTLSRGAVAEATDLRASLRREENARKIAVAEVDRLRIALNVACGENEG